MNNRKKRFNAFILTIICLWKISEFRVSGADCSTAIQSSHCTLTCTNNPKELTVETMSCTPQVIFITEARDGFKFSGGVFSEYQNTVTNLIIRYVKFTFTETVSQFVSNVFKDMTKLTLLEIMSSQLTDEYAWVIPQHVDVVIFDNNSYTQLDLSANAGLKECSVNLNKFKKLPKFSNPSQLKSLHMTYNPLTELTLEEVGALCFLTHFELLFSIKDDFVNVEGYCICTELKKWAAEYNIRGMNGVQCATPISEISCKSNWDEAVNKRNECFAAQPIDWFTIIISILIGMFFLAVLIVLGVLYYFRVKGDEELGPSSGSRRQSEYDEDEEDE